MSYYEVSSPKQNLPGHLQVFQRAMEAAESIQDIRFRLKTLKAIAPHLRYLSEENVSQSRDVLFRVWKDTLHKIAEQNRKNFLYDLGKLSAYIFALGGKEAVSKTYDAIKKTGQWWE